MPLFATRAFSEPAIKNEDVGKKMMQCFPKSHFEKESPEMLIMRADFPATYARFGSLDLRWELGLLHLTTDSSDWASLENSTLAQ